MEINKMNSEQSVAEKIADHFGLPLVDLDNYSLHSMPLALINEQLISAHGMLPLYIKNNYLYVATDDPSKQSALKEIQFHTGLIIQPVVVETKKLSKLIDKVLKKRQQLNFLEEDPSVIALVDHFLEDAIQKSSSDIHFEPYESKYRIRYRQDGILHEIAEPSLTLNNRINTCIKIMAGLDITEKRLPQDGRFTLSKKNQIRDCRVSSCPTVNGEKIVIRLLDSHMPKLGIEELGFNQKQKETLILTLKRTQGMVIVTGPTGSGKTLTLYTALNFLNSIEKNISTVEDPVEIKIPGINQVSINPKTGLHFSTVLRAFLRQDPDIIMVGEMRDFETTEIAIKAAQTGHLVLSTLHTNSATETLTRLLNIGIPAFNIASSLSLIIAQRLVRRSCEYCKAYGCEHCTNGYKGRIGLFEVLPLSPSLSQIILSGGKAPDLMKQALSEGMTTIYESGLEKVSQGLTTLEEVNRVTL
jgi:type IV pilus assembly protein PilB